MLFFKKVPNTFPNFKYDIVKKGVTSGGSRLSYKFTRKLPIFIKNKKTIVTIPGNSGRGGTGRTVIFTKSKRCFKKKIMNINYSYRLRSIGFVASIIISPFTHKLISLLYLSTGSVTYLPTTFKNRLFILTRLYNFSKNLFRYKNKLDFLNKRLFIDQGFFLIKQLIRNQKVNLLELLPLDGVKYVRSPGSSGFLSKMDKRTSTALVRLPSGVRKVFSIFSIGSLGSNPLSDNKYWKSNKAGYYKNFGKKSKVRGVAKNPIDHPHGGRAKSISYQRTPWGKTTKFK